MTRCACDSNHPSCETDARPIRGPVGERALTTRQVTHILDAPGHRFDIRACPGAYRAGLGGWPPTLLYLAGPCIYSTLYLTLT